MTITETKVRAQSQTELAEPLNYYVVMHNDDATPFDFVIDVLIEIFHHEHQQAIDLTYKIHEDGNAIVGMYNIEIAEQKVADVTLVATSHSYPLKTTIEPA